jgi:hypothetical protein
MLAIKKYTAVLALILFLLASCINTNIQDESPLINTSTASPPVLLTATATETPSPTSLPTAFPTLPTLLPEDAYALLLRMLNENETCRLPCWLDITPGTSAHIEAYQKWAGFLMPLLNEGTPKSYPYDFQYRQNDFGYSINTFEQKYNLNDKLVSINPRYYLQSNSDTIDWMAIDTQALQVAENRIYTIFESPIYKKILDSYLLPSILTKYGQPEQILLSMEIFEAEPGDPDYFRIWLLYPALGSIIQYWGNAEVDNGIIHGCPSDTFVSLWLFPPNNAEMYQEMLVESMSEPYSAFYKPTEDALGMTQEEFYNLFSKTNSQCIESPLDIWPPH